MGYRGYDDGSDLTVYSPEGIKGLALWFLTVMALVPLFRAVGLLLATALAYSYYLFKKLNGSDESLVLIATIWILTVIGTVGAGPGGSPSMAISLAFILVFGIGFSISALAIADAA